MTTAASCRQRTQRAGRAARRSCSCCCGAAPDAADSHFGCSINPRQEALAKTQAFLASSSQKPLEPGQRKKWLGDLRDTVGKQDIEIFGIDPASRVASVLVEADYHMKLIGMGLADGVDGVESYLDSIELARAAGAPPADVGAAVVVRAQLRLDRAVGRRRCVRARRPGRARAQRERDAGRAGPARSHGPERSAQPAICGDVSRPISASWRRSIRCTASCETFSIWRWPWH